MHKAKWKMRYCEGGGAKMSLLVWLLAWLLGLGQAFIKMQQSKIADFSESLHLHCALCE